MKNKLKYQFYRFLSTLTFGKLKLKMLNKKNEYKRILNSPNTICINGENNTYDKEKIKLNNIELKIVGNNNEINLDFDKIKGNNPHLRINIFGDNNKVSIGANLTIHEYLFIDIAYPPHKSVGSEVLIGNNFGLGNMEIMLLEDNSKCTIGDNCMFAQNIIMRLSDTHSVLDLEGNLLNYGGLVEIGNHVWCGREVRILKNISIGNNSIIGASSVITKRFDENNIAIGGNPAKIIKRNINWSRLSPQQYLEQQKQQDVNKNTMEELKTYE